MLPTALLIPYHPPSKNISVDIWLLNLSAATDDAKPVTHLLAIDISSKHGAKLLHVAIRYLVDVEHVTCLPCRFFVCCP
jgi:UDP-glucose:glycoprotein glucosyltransferase